MDRLEVDLARCGAWECRFDADLGGNLVAGELILEPGGQIALGDGFPVGELDGC